MFCAATPIDLPFRSQLDSLRAKGRHRRLVPRNGTDFSSNDYLGLAGSDRLVQAVEAALARGVPVGSGGSRLLRGNHEEHEALEYEAGRLFCTEAALYFSSGFAANATLLATLPQRGDLVVYDALAHASAHEGMRLGRAEFVAAAHKDLDQFEGAIRDWRHRGGTGRVWLAIESLYSMDGDRAPLDQIAAIADAHEAFLLIDEAHATGIFGPDGRGLGAHLDSRANVISLRTCGEALGCEGALLTGPAFMLDFLINRGRGFIFSTAPSPLIASAVREALRILVDERERRARLHSLTDNAHAALGSGAAKAGRSQIIPIIVGDDVVMVRALRMLMIMGKRAGRCRELMSDQRRR